MKELKIYEYQAKEIEDALRMVANTMESHKKETCLDRSVMQALGFIRNCIAEDIDKNPRRD